MKTASDPSLENNTVSASKNSKLSSILGMVSSGASFASLYSICHAACQGLITLLAVLGIAVAGMPLAFLQNYTLPLAGFSSAMLVVSSWLILKKHRDGCHTSKHWKFWLSLNAVLLIVNIVVIIWELTH